MSSTDPLRVALTVEQLWQPVPGGSGTYVRELLTSLAATGSVDVVGITARGSDPSALGSDALDGLELAAAALPRRLLYEAWNRLRSPRWRLVPRPAADATVLHATTWAVPPRVKPLVVTVHDLAFLRSPEHFTRRGNSWFRRALDVVRREADLVITPSGATADDCVRNGIDADKVRTVPHGVHRPTTTEADVESFRRHHRLERPYVLWCGTLEPRKNVPGLVEAFARIAPDLSDVDLVLVGPDGWGDTSARIDTLLAGPLRGRVHPVGRLDNATLQAAYAGARAFAFPSLWEGFGMPVLEAMAHGLPVVTSAGTSMAEFATGVGRLVPPTDLGALADALASAVGPEHDAMAARSRERAAEYSWSRTAQQHVAVYRELV